MRIAHVMTIIFGPSIFNFAAYGNHTNVFVLCIGTFLVIWLITCNAATSEIKSNLTETYSNFNLYLPSVACSLQILFTDFQRQNFRLDNHY